MGQTNKCALLVADGKEADLLPGRFESKESQSTLLQYVLDSVWTVVDEIIVAFAKEPKLALVETIAPFGVKIAVDRSGSSILSRVVAGFKVCSSESCFVLPTSTPFVKPNVIFELFEELRGHDAAIPRWKGGQIEPLLAVYKKKPFLKAVSSVAGDNLESIVENLYAVTFVGVEEKLQPLDPELLTFFRINTMKDLEKAKTIATAEIK